MHELIQAVRARMVDRKTHTTLWGVIPGYGHMHWEGLRHNAGLVLPITHMCRHVFSMPTGDFDLIRASCSRHSVFFRNVRYAAPPAYRCPKNRFSNTNK